MMLSVPSSVTRCTTLDRPHISSQSSRACASQLPQLELSSLHLLSLGLDLRNHRISISGFEDWEHVCLNLQCLNLQCLNLQCCGLASRVCKFCAQLGFSFRGALGSFGRQSVDMTRPPTSSCSSDERDGLKKGPWTPDEDQKLVAYIQERDHGSWRSLPVNAGLQRCGKSCRLRWTNYLRPDIKRGRFSEEEDRMIVHLHAILGNRWSAIASHIPRRTDNEIKNYWNTHLKKRLVQMGIDPVSHNSTIVDDFDALKDLLPGLRPVVCSNLTHMSQWENARAEAEARLSRRQSTLASSSHEFNVAPRTLTGRPQSTSYMSSWKEQVAETLRPNFGVVEVEKTPVNLRTFLQEWDSSLRPQLQLSAFSGYDSPIEVPDGNSGTSSDVVSPCETPQPCLNYTLPSSAQITERLLASRCNLNDNNIMFPLESDSQASSFHINFPGEVPVEAPTEFSPTTSLQGPDHDSSYTNSPCVSSSTGDSFELLSQNLGLNEMLCSRGSFSVLPQVAGAVPSFWSRQQVAMADALQPEPGCFFLPGELPPPKPSFSTVPTVTLGGVPSVPNDIPIPQFDFLC